MKSTIDLPDDLSRRVDLIAQRTNLTRSRIVEDALAYGRSLAWQEQWAAGVKAGLDDADQGNFASEEEIAAVLNRYNQA
ncbi:CopG family ribbon-helix-helix protein [Agrobacterium sp. rho-13.3]|jgi:predicted transcriptional regulator|uniref:CopG family ribbon-helix-helix protein n=1 Tax=Agrobacterium sp. rho-13.3 TaxID=3072980 RepID=UPI002A11C64E|nr:ribbon-helix-helix protein, CopG family [Agrobacterium sp. rho-13.3]MDX8307619.1 ribbon-helix-helix protein, CopG family [Agrobacterium sp. rho-13.3]